MIYIPGRAEWTRGALKFSHRRETDERVALYIEIRARREISHYVEDIKKRFQLRCVPSSKVKSHYVSL